MEIITYVRTGTIIHKDSLGNEGRTSAGDGAGDVGGARDYPCGTFRSIGGYDPVPDLDSPEGTRHYPRWDQKAFPKAPVNENLNLLVSGRAEDEGSDALKIHQDAAI